MSIIHIEAMTKEFPGRANRDTVVALDRVSLDVDEGEILCIVGRSGCGKTTLLNILAGFEQPTSGFATFLGQRIEGPDPKRGVVFQDAALFPWLSASQNIQFGLKEQGLGRQERSRIAADYLALVGLGEARDRLPSALSGGMRQRVALARVLANGASVLLLDEPFAALDEQTRSLMHHELLRIWQETKATMVLITHSIDEAVVLGDRVVVMEPGPGRIREILDVPMPRPRDDTSAAFNAVKRRVRSMISEPVSEAAV
jgi:NitT/TauT family transport system ATP-binding protein